MTNLDQYSSGSLISAPRIYFALILIFVGILLISTRLWYLQVQRGHIYYEVSLRNRIKKSSIPAPRGKILDRDGRTLLENRSFFDLVIIPQYLPSPKKREDGTSEREIVFSIIAKLFHLELDDIYSKMESARSRPKFAPVRIKRNLSLHDVALLESNKIFLPGVDVDVIPLRDYKRGDPAHLLGYLREVNKDFLANANKTSKLYKSGDLIGKNGVERKFEEYLRGKEGTENLQVDALGRLRFLTGGHQSREEPTPGNNVELTIDQDIQEAASLAFRNKHGAVVAVSAKTGEILAYVSNPNYDLAIFQDKLSSKDWVPLSTNRFRPLLDRVTGGQYPPGSTFKIITALAALEENVVSPQKTYYCNGVFRLGNRPFQCWKKVGHGNVNLRYSLEQSCDVYHYQIGNLLGVEKIAKWSKLFGLGSKTELNLNTEATGLVPTPEWKLKNKGVKWQKGDTINISIGQGFMLTTPLQVVNMFAALGNGGKLYKPYILKRVIDSTGKVVVEEKPTLRWEIPAKEWTVEEVKEGLWDVVNGSSGTGRRSQVKGFSVSGKTGTAQTAKLSLSKNAEDVSRLQRDHAWFAAYSPSDDPEIAVVALSEYDGGGGGSQAAPIVQKVIEAYWKKKHPEKFVEN